MGLFDLFKKKSSFNESEEEFASSLLEYDNGLLSVLSPDYIQEHDNYVQLGSNYTRTLMLMDYNTLISQEDIQEWSEISDNVSISYHIKKISTNEVRANLSKAIKQSRLKQADERLDDATKVEAEVQERDATRVIRELSSGSEKMFELNTLFHLNAPNLEELDRLTQKVKSLIGSTATAYAPNLRAMDAFHSFLPLGELKVTDLTSRLVNSEALSFFFPFHENEMFQESGMYFGINEKTKNVILVDQDLLLNKHKVYIGVSGVGKSTALFADMMKEYMTGTKIQVNDPKGEFGSKFKTLGGEWIKFSLEATTSRINPFDLPKQSFETNDDDDTVTATNPIYNKIPQLIVMFKLMYPDMTIMQENVLSTIILDVYKSVGIDSDNESLDYSKLKPSDFPTLSDFDVALATLQSNDPETYEYVRTFHKGIELYIRGIYRHTFNGYTNVNIDSDLVAYDSLSFASNENVQRILYYNIMSHMTYEAINGDGSPMRFVFDEAHVIADPNIPLAMKQLFYMLKVLRSFNVGVSTATQSIKDFLSAKDRLSGKNYGEAVINQSVQKMYLPMMAFEIDFLEKELSHSFSDKERSILTVRDGDKAKQAGKGILFIGSKKIYTAVKLTPMEEQLWFKNKKLHEIVI
ncbi:TrsE [Exiguobacterium sp. BG5(2022)]|uniref:VirB4 family type IV secretion system protein n=1 Tax=Exiguobacterium sp. BG5(2022) TaxID=2962595 RepID=UPI00288250D4|nr:TrsE [Exiguobacterium sp. BG5(2022)]MDT0193673.1 TrsE [Exiguobacterium sp. BG5(2022)]